jgi:hypothetical protein
MQDGIPLTTETQSSLADVWQVANEAVIGTTGLADNAAELSQAIKETAEEEGTTAALEAILGDDNNPAYQKNAEYWLQNAKNPPGIQSLETIEALAKSRSEKLKQQALDDNFAVKGLTNRVNLQVPTQDTTADPKAKPEAVV